jgi:hypothetical protein
MIYPVGKTTVAFIGQMNVFRNCLPAIASVMATPALTHACAVCLTGAGEDPVTDAFNWSVLFLMATPYTVVGAIVGWLIYAKRRSAADVRSESDSERRAPLPMIQKESER